MKLKDLTGRTFGKWRVLSRAHVSANGQIYWNCACECGTRRPVNGGSLKKGDSASCNCSKAEYGKAHPEWHRKLRPFEAAFNALLRSCKTRSIACVMKYEEFLTFTDIAACYYCGDAVHWTRFNAQAGNQRYNLDRKDNDLPYSKSNCVVCCATCNWMKGTMEAALFVTQAAKIARNLEAR